MHVAAVKHSLLLVLTTLLVACQQDPREAVLVVQDARLEDATTEAALYWSNATHGNVRFEERASCDDDRACVKLRVGDKWDDRAHTSRDGYGSGVITVHSTTLDVGDVYLTSAITHELGHILWLEHVPGAEVMNALEFGPDGHTCIGPETLLQYQDRYEVIGKKVCW